MNICVKIKMTKGYTRLCKIIRRKMKSLNIFRYNYQYLGDEGELIFAFWSISEIKEMDYDEELKVYMYFIDSDKSLIPVLDALEDYAYFNNLITDEHYDSLDLDFKLNSKF
jgi:hypothetical protein